MSRWTLIASIISLLLLLIGIVLLSLNVKIIKSVAKKKLVLENGTETYETWLNPPVPFYVRVYVFDISNSKEFAAGSEKLNLTQIGPFVYQEFRTKDVDPGEKTLDPTITYKPRNYYKFVPEMSVSNDDVSFTTVNIALISARKLAIKLEPKMPGTSGLIKAAMKEAKEKLMITQTVRGLVWGHKSKLFTVLRAMLQGFKGKFARLMPPPSWASSMINMTDKEGNWTVTTGSEDFRSLAQLKKWNGKETFNIYNGTCDKVLGSDGAQFPPDVVPQDKLAIFSGDICRPVWFSYKEKSKVKSFKTMRFELMEVNNKHLSGEKCFCVDKNEDDCSDELMDISYCKQDAPIFISKPHFLDALKHLENITGLEPSKEKHESWMDVEPWTGIPLKASVKFQVNIETQPEPAPPAGLYNMTYPSKIVPLLWFEQMAEVDDVSSKKLNSRLFNKITMFRAVTGVMIGIGIVGLITVGYLYMKKKRSGVNEEENEKRNFVVM